MIKNNSSNQTSGFLSLCYHYIRPERENDKFSRLYGSSEKMFDDNLKNLIYLYHLISIENAQNFCYGNFFFKEKNGLLVTFDDGLSDHYRAASILSKYSIKGLFFIPTCIFQDKLPASPNIIHYGIAKFGIEKFLKEYHRALDYYGLSSRYLEISYVKGTSDIWHTINNVKFTFKTQLDYSNSRKIILYIYENLLEKNLPEILSTIHLTKEQVKEMLELGHSIGIHTRSHISVGFRNLSKKEFNKEIIEPQKYLENEFNTKVIAFSYPFGNPEDCLSSKGLLEKTKVFKMAFTTAQILNTKNTNPLELGRYQPTSNDTTEKLLNILKKMLAP